MMTRLQCGSDQRLVFLFGSGLSCGAGLPGVGCLTRAALHSDERELEGFIATLKAKADLLHGSCQSTYEDIYYLAVQLRDHLLENHENPALIPFVCQLCAELKVSERSLEDLASRVMDRIVEVVAGMLLAGSSANPLNTFHAACAGTDVIPQVFTLNHDLLFEQSLHDAWRDDWITGFRSFHGAWAWDPPLHVAPESPCFIKLHGSVDWWRVRPTSYDAHDAWREERIVAGPSPDGFEEMDTGPLILAGTFNKLADYTRTMFLWMHNLFYQCLHQSDRLIVCGYGFSDKGINTQITD